jgi:hypothetical protein
MFNSNATKLYYIFVRFWDFISLLLISYSSAISLNVRPETKANATYDYAIMYMVFLWFALFGWGIGIATQKKSGISDKRIEDRSMLSATVMYVLILIASLYIFFVTFLFNKNFDYTDLYVNVTNLILYISMITASNQAVRLILHTRPRDILLFLLGLFLVNFLILIFKESPRFMYHHFIIDSFQFITLALLYKFTGQRKSSRIV